MRYVPVLAASVAAFLMLATPSLAQQGECGPPPAGDAEAPRPLTEGGLAGWPDILDGLRLTGHFLERSVLTDRRHEVLAARERLLDRLKRAVA